MANTPPVPTQAVVQVKSAWLSKINWTQLAGPIATGAAYFGLTGVTESQLAAIFLGIQSLQSVLTIILKTYFTPTVTPASIAPPSLGQ